MRFSAWLIGVWLISMVAGPCGVADDEPAEGSAPQVRAQSRIRQRRCRLGRN